MSDASASTGSGRNSDEAGFAVGRRLREAMGVILEVLEIPEDQLFFKVRRQQRG